MKSSLTIKCQCGKETVLEATGSQPFPDTDCPDCGAGIRIIDNGFVSWRVFNRSLLELEFRDFTLSIILSAMAVECELARLFMKWKNIELVMLGTLATQDQEDSWEDELRKTSRIVTRLDLICKFLAGEDFDAFFSKNAGLIKALRERHPESVGSTSPKAFFQQHLFRKRNGIVHFGRIDFGQSEAEACHHYAATLFQALREMDFVRIKKLDASFPHS
jgi:hypothetical protein